MFICHQFRHKKNSDLDDTGMYGDSMAREAGNDRWSAGVNKILRERYPVSSYFKDYFYSTTMTAPCNALVTGHEALNVHVLLPPLVLL